MIDLKVLSIAFGELDISPLTVAILATLTLSVFFGVGISSIALFRSITEKK